MAVAEAVNKHGHGHLVKNFKSSLVPFQTIYSPYKSFGPIKDQNDQSGRPKWSPIFSYKIFQMVKQCRARVPEPIV